MTRLVETTTPMAAALLAAVLLAVAAAASDLQLDYSVISDTGKSCPGRDSCRQTRNTRGPAKVEMDWKKSNCFCDNSCAVYGDCCVDAPAYRQDEQMVRGRRSLCETFAR
jgi:hypothetical protein